MSPDEMFGRLPSGEIKRLLALGQAPRRDALLDEQLQQQIAAGQPSGEEYSTGAGAALGGLGDVIKGTASAAHVQALRGQQQQNLTGDNDARQLALQTAGRSVMDPGELAGYGGQPSAPPMVDAGQPMSQPPMVQAEPDAGSAPATAGTVAALRGQPPPVTQGVPQQGPTSVADGGELAKLLRGAKTAHPYTF